MSGQIAGSPGHNRSRPPIRHSLASAPRSAIVARASPWVSVISVMGDSLESRGGDQRAP